MSDIKFEILYQSRIIIVILNSEENDNNLFNKFIEQLKKELDINDTNKKAIFKIMTLNTKEMYLIVNEDNFENIIQEKTKEGIIKLFLDINFIEENEPLEIKNDIKNNELDEDFNEEISLSKLSKNNPINNEENNENKNVNKESNENNNNIINMNIINNDEIDFNNDKNNYENNNNNKNILNKQSDNSEFNSNIINENIINSNNNANNLLKDKEEQKIDINPKDIKNIININNKNQINPKPFNKQMGIIEICTICQNLIKENIKYECCICDQCILCQNCEKTHDHPCFKFKRDINFLKTLKDCHFFMSQKQNFNSILPIKYIKNIFNHTYDVTIQLEIDDHIEFGPNTSIEIPFKIRNVSDFPINSDDFTIILRNYSIVNMIYDTKDKFFIGPKNFIKKNLICQSKDKMGRETIMMEIYSNKIKIRENESIREFIEVVISDDEENKELNKKFTFHPKIQLLNKLRKKMLLYILDNHFVEKNVTQIYESLMNNKWDLDAALNHLRNN